MQNSIQFVDWVYRFWLHTFQCKWIFDNHQLLTEQSYCLTQTPWYVKFPIWNRPPVLISLHTWFQEAQVDVFRYPKKSKNEFDCQTFEMTLTRFSQFVPHIVLFALLSIKCTHTHSLAAILIRKLHAFMPVH